MTEQEKRRRRREMERRMRTRTEMRKKTGKRRGLTAFRIYVTAILTGGFLLISAFRSDTSGFEYCAHNLCSHLLLYSPYTYLNGHLPFEGAYRKKKAAVPCRI